MTYLIVDGELKFNKWVYGVYEFEGEADIDIDDEIVVVDNGVYSGVVKKRIGNKFVVLPELYKYNLFDVFIEECEIDIKKEYLKVDAGEIIMNAYEGLIFDIGDRVWVAVSDGLGNIYDEDFFYGVVEGKGMQFGKYKLQVYGIISILAKRQIEKYYVETTAHDIIKDLLMECLDYDVVISEELPNIYFDAIYLTGTVFENVQYLLKGLMGHIVVKENVIYVEPLGKEMNMNVIDSEFGVCLEAEERTDNLYNSIVFEFGDIGYDKVEVFTGDGSTREFGLMYEPSEPYEVKINGVTLNFDKYYVDSLNKKIVFYEPPANGAEIRVKYVYKVTLVIKLRNEDSIKQFGERQTRVISKYVKDMVVARELARSYLKLYSEPATRAKFKTVIEKLVDKDVKVGQTIRLKIDELGIVDDVFVKSVRVQTGGVVECEFGDEVYDIVAWYSEIKRRIEEIEKSISAKKLIYETKDLVDGMKVLIVDDVDVNVAYIMISRLGGVIGVCGLGEFIMGVGVAS